MHIVGASESRAEAAEVTRKTTRVKIKNHYNTTIQEL